MDQITLMSDMDTVLQDSQLKKQISENQAIKKKFDSYLKKQQSLLEKIKKETEELQNSLVVLEDDQCTTEVNYKNESNLVISQQIQREEKEREMKFRNDFKMQYNERLMKATSNLSSTDQLSLDTFKRKIEAYFHLSGVKWDYQNCDKDQLSGYIQNAPGTKVKIFRLNIKDKNEKEIANEMWALIKKLSSRID